MNTLEKFKVKAEKIEEMEVAWKKRWKHREPPCEEWSLNEKLYGEGDCKHYAKARARHFKAEIRELWDISKWDEDPQDWIYIKEPILLRTEKKRDI